MLDIIAIEERDHQKLLNAWSVATNTFRKQDALLERCDKSKIKGAQRASRRDEQAGFIMLKRKSTRQTLKKSPRGRGEVFFGGKIVLVDETDVY